MPPLLLTIFGTGVVFVVFGEDLRAEMRWFYSGNYPDRISPNAGLLITYCALTAAFGIIYFAARLAWARLA